jgi:hypothetical protein
MVETEMEIQPDGLAGDRTRVRHRTETASAHHQGANALQEWPGITIGHKYKSYN